MSYSYRQQFDKQKNLQFDTAMAALQYYTCLTLFGILLLAMVARAQDYGLEENVKELVARRKSLEFMKQLVEDIDDQLNRLHFATSAS
ncbi:uncharacterized protein LOC118188019 isoform X3 [Stegodyphus dumicola]|uniref:uncharacterized protein LOC118188019 isoform X3 n=1 Tax=Stegodyphus dumicola TaxID=202533 RepID=UPI0015AA2124|nr:uncharacterized protein LOC118188019 isoform X3 [Stegodyphus dumicola]